MTAVESFFQINAYHPFARCSHPHKHSGPVPLTEIQAPGAHEKTFTRHMLHFCPHANCSGLVPEEFRSNRKDVNNMDFLEASKIFSYRTTDPKETSIRNPIRTFREFTLYTNRTANHKASGKDRMPADLFKRAPEAFRKRTGILINIILSGHYVCSEAMLEARVVLLCKDHANPSSLSNYRPIALCNALYQLINIIITSRLRRLTEKYAVLESSQHGLRGSRSV